MTPVPQTSIAAENIIPPPAFGCAPSPLILSDRLLTLAQDADRAGYPITAEHLLHLAHTVLDEKSQH